MSQAVIVTGATGFLGSHLVASILENFAEMPVICLSRSKSGRSAEERVVDGVRQAFDHRGTARTPVRWSDRLIVAEDDPISMGPLGNGDLLRLTRGHRVEEFWHCAASVEFSGSHGGKVWQTNVDGLQNALEVAGQLGVSTFNHVSTAYVAGKMTGRIMETRGQRPPGYNNIYEESKHLGEDLVAHYCRANRMGYRIFRPSIVVGHSRTFQTSSSTGFYHFVDLTKGFYERMVTRDAGFFDRHKLKIQVHREGVLNLIPVDIAVAEMIDLCAAGVRTLSQVFHITSETPVSFCDMFQTVLSAVGIKSFELVGPEADLTTADRIYNRGLMFYMPYLNNRKIFDRSNVAMHGVDHHQVGFVLDVNRLQKFVRHYLEAQEEARLASGEDGLLAPILSHVGELAVR